MLQALKRWFNSLTRKNVDSIMADFQAARNQLLEVSESNNEELVYLDEEMAVINAKVVSNKLETARANRIAHVLEEILV